MALDQTFLNELCAPFRDDEVKTRSVQGKVLHYITDRTVMNRLDNVVGVENWTADYEPLDLAGLIAVRCRLSIRADGSCDYVTKTALGGCSQMPDPSDTIKSGQADSLKRAAVQFGIGRYLYRDGVPDYLDHQEPPAAPPPAPPQAPSRPAAAPPQPARATPPPPSAARHVPQLAGPPPTQQGTFKWIKDLERHFKTDLVSISNQFCDQHGYAKRSNEWDDWTVQAVTWHLIDQIKGFPSYQGEFNHLQDPRRPE